MRFFGGLYLGALHKSHINFTTLRIISHNYHVNIRDSSLVNGLEMQLIVLVINNRFAFNVFTRVLAIKFFDKKRSKTKIFLTT